MNYNSQTFVLQNPSDNINISVFCVNEINSLKYYLEEVTPAELYGVAMYSFFKKKGGEKTVKAKSDK